ncbi:MAG: polysaccharide biosynthesis protein [Xanthomonadaceae bacterium]|nr:polysaccharide biosynthesis protein [Xanthomonadaceae bacterium]
MPADSDAGLVEHRRRRSIAQMDESEQLLPSKILEQRGLIHASMRNSGQVDRVRELRSNVLTRSTLRTPVLMVTGVSRGCGASYLARNLAASIALDEERTALLMECDHRSATLASDFSLPDDASGLSDLFGGGVRDLSSVIHPSGVERLRLIPAGRGVRRGPEHFASIRMRALVKEIRERYDDRYLIIDAPPVLGAPDARILSEYADLIILVVGEGRHRPEVIRRAADTLPPERFAGVVFNHLP